jgi:hypothetical protein
MRSGRDNRRSFNGCCYGMPCQSAGELILLLVYLIILDVITREAE